MSKDSMSKDEWEALDFTASRVFSPAAPIREKDVFAGRRDEIRAAIDAINQAGQHAAIYGERGVGKTSLANVIHEFIVSTGQTKVLHRISTATAKTTSRRCGFACLTKSRLQIIVRAWASVVKCRLM